MSWLRHRQQLLFTAAVDAIFIVIAVPLISEARHGEQLNSATQTIGLICSYLILGWLFGSYSLLRWPKLKWNQLVQRVGLSALATLVLALTLGWLSKTTPLQLPLLQRGNIGPLMLSTAFASALFRALLHRLQTQRSSTYQILVDQSEKDQVEAEWLRNNRQAPNIITFDLLAILLTTPGELLAISPIIQKTKDLEPIFQKALVQKTRLLSLAQLAEEELQRIPAHWLDESIVQLSGLANGREIGINSQLKRLADLILGILLILSAAIILLPIAIAIYWHDRGPIFYSQIRTGLFGESFTIYKLRTMQQTAEENGAQWSKPGDKRITPIGKWLRRSRLDELPQLLNIIKGDMSFIGPRPERPELERDLEVNIPHYRLRHLVRPGLSGWAQVNMAYTSSVEDAKLKLSYDLYYLKNNSFWLDLLILAKTFKTVLKGAGR
ncbi:MAG: sugar transferase [Synechococcus sp. SupBloom_Metag_053]|nr:sugar transferase [Synechococcus sp. SupBloom_Metag_053]